MGELRGKQLMPKDIAKLCYEAGWTEAVELAEIVATCLSESQGYQGAVNDNYEDDGVTVKSRDCGLFQINIPASKIGTLEETKLFEDPVYNVYRARLLFENRGFQPWYAHTLNVYLRDTYLERATRGVGNFLAEVFLARTPTDTLSGEPYVHKFKTPPIILDFSRRTAVLAGGNSRAITMLQAIKPLAPSAIDVKINEVINVLTIARNEAKK